MKTTTFTRALLLLAVLCSVGLSACSSPPADDGRAGIPGRLERADRAQDELSRESGSR